MDLVFQAVDLLLGLVHRDPRHGLRLAEPAIVLGGSVLAEQTTTSRTTVGRSVPEFSSGGHKCEPEKSENQKVTL
jgi:hypothetical protein